MKIRFWGTRGSIPVSGEEFLKYGGSTTCVAIDTNDGEKIIIDAGTGIRKLGNMLMSRRENHHHYNILFTHSHWDHIMGFPFFKPIYHKDTSIKVFGCPFAQESVRQIISEAMEPPFFPIQCEDIRADIEFTRSCTTKFGIGGVEIIPVLLSHPNKGIGYKFVENGKSFVFLTDNELSFQHPGGLKFSEYVDFCKDADLLVHDAEYTEEEYEFTKTWGHSTYIDALNLAIAADVSMFVLWHHNQERTDADLNMIVEDCREKIKKASLKIECLAAREGQVIELK